MRYSIYMDTMQLSNGRTICTDPRCADRAAHDHTDPLDRIAQDEAERLARYRRTRRINRGV